ncbi:MULTISPECIES: helix-turn-helix domain-containing protein [unclassified Variovorax]|uniref:helix-turn-helix domain-containing protein n=1 Tax=unclassified Variovorax TaxID=663243 RepID=UPI001BD2E786|nr:MULTISPECIES: helix-turn-helix domain-containing protein [unclassified Variovorax]
MTHAASVMSPTEVNPVIWAAEVRRNFFPLELSVDRSQPFEASVQLGNFSRCKVAQVRAGAHSASMSGEDCRHLGQRYIKVLWQERGHGHLDMGARAVDLPAGHWTVYEASRSYALRMEGDTTFTAMVCDTGGHDGLASLAQRVAGRAMPTEGGAAVALAALAAMRGEGSRVAPQSQAGVADFVTSLLAQEIQHVDSSNGAARKRAQDALLREAQDYVRQNLDRNDLSPDQIAAAIHVSRRTLYHAFELAGETPQAMVQRLRLERCRDVLSHAGGQGPSITQLALEFGFSDPAYFTRVFRQRFGSTPSKYRAQALAH